MRARPDWDRLAVWSYQQAGEEIPHGDPSVTDAERSAAGRETIAARFQALLPANRIRAAERFAAGGLPDGEDVVRVWQQRDPAELRARLTEPPLAVWAEDDVLSCCGGATRTRFSYSAGCSHGCGRSWGPTTSGRRRSGYAAWTRR